MDTVVLYVLDRISAMESLTYLCNDIKAREDANHQLYFKRMMFGGYHVFRGNPDTKDICDREIIIFPADKPDRLEKLNAGKNILVCKNCKWVTGEGKGATRVRKLLIDWLLGSDVSFDETTDEKEPQNS